LLFIDEIQNSPAALKNLRYFYEQKKDLYVIAAGSLLEALFKSRPAGFPAGRVEFLYLYPATFREFLQARQETQALAYYDTVPLDPVARAPLLKLFHEYALVGGMPEAVRKYAAGDEVTALNPVYESLVNSYLGDTEKYAGSGKQRQVLRHCLEAIPGETGQRIKFHGFGRSGYGSREAGEALRIIEKAMLIYLVYPTTGYALPARPDRRKYPLLQFIDTGLLNYTAGLQASHFSHPDLCSLHQGIVAEHIVRQELIAGDLERRTAPLFWVRDKKQAQAQLDAVIPYQDRLVPLEVKAGKTGRLRSLHAFIDRAPCRLAVRLYAGELAIAETQTPEGKPYRLVNLPYFLAGKIHEYLDHYAIA